MGRRWGQHFLRSRNVVEKIVAAAELEESSSVLEIGPGEGVLTVPLTQAAKLVHAYEIDAKLAAGLRSLELPNLVVHEGDFLKDSLELDAGTRWKVVANLPYYITAPILEKLLWRRELVLERGILMMQEEVARRICEPASRQAGALTYIVGAFHQVEYLFKVPPGCFAPPPKVDSAVVKVVPREQPDRGPGLTRHYERLVNVSFQTRRKQLGRSLRSVSPQAPEILSEAGIDPKRRPETLTVQDFWTLARTWANSV